MKKTWLVSVCLMIIAVVIGCGESTKNVYYTTNNPTCLACQNQAPVANDDSYGVDQDTLLVIDSPGVLNNDTDKENNRLVAYLSAPAKHGAINLLPDGSFSYTPDQNFIGTDIFRYFADDGSAFSNDATVTITVNNVNQSPIANNDQYTVNVNQTLNQAVPGVKANDSDPDNDQITVVRDSSPSHGTLTLNSDGSFSYVPDTDYSGPDSFTYYVNDGQLDSNIATVTINVISSGILNASLNPLSPNKQLLISGSQKQTVAIFELQANHVENQDLDKVTISFIGTGTATGIANIYLYSSSRSDGGSIADPIAVAVGSTVATFVLPDNTVVIPANGSVVLTVKIDVAPVDGITVLNGMYLKAVVANNGDIQATGLTSGATINSLGVVVSAATHVLYATRPYFSLNASSPSGSLVTGANTLLAIFNVQADPADPVVFHNFMGNSITVNIASNCNSGSVGMTLRDELGNVLDIQAVDVCSASTVTFIFGSNDFVMAAGQTRKLYVYANTMSATNAGDVIQLFLSDSLPSNIDWGIQGTGNYHEADVIFRGTIYANALSK